MALACKLHLELIYQHERKSVWDLWIVIEGSHMQQDVSAWYAAGMSLLGVCKAADEHYTEYLNRVTDTRYRINHITPARMTHKEKMDKIVLFASVCSLPADDPMRLQLVMQTNISFLDVT